MEVEGVAVAALRCEKVYPERQKVHRQTLTRLLVIVSLQVEVVEVDELLVEVSLKVFYMDDEGVKLLHSAGTGGGAGRPPGTAGGETASRGGTGSMISGRPRL